MFLFRSLSVARAMIVITALGLIAVLFYASFGIVTEYNTVQRTNKDKEYAGVVDGVTTMIHELQKERGASAGFLASQGANFADALKQQRLKADAAIKDYQAATKKVLSRDTNKAVRDNMAIVDRNLSDLQELRKKVDSFDITVAGAVAQITALNRSAIQLAPEIGKLIGNSNAARAVQRHSILLRAKDIIGLERATGATGLARAHAAESGFAQATLDRLQALTAERTTLLGVYAPVASTKIVEMLSNTLSSDAATDVEAMRAAITTQEFDPIRNIQPEAWFEAVTVLLAQFKAMEDQGVEDFRGHLIDAYDEARRLLRVEVLITVATFLILAVVSGLFVRENNKSLNRVTARVADLAQGDIESEIIQEEQSDLRRITEALREFQSAELERRAQVELQAELEKRSAKGISRIVNNVRVGEFDQRLRLRDLEGPSKILGEGINEIMTVADEVVSAQRDADQAALEAGRKDAKVQAQSVERLNQIVVSFSKGDFSQRMDVADLSGVWEDLGRGINQIASTCETALSEVRTVFAGMAEGNISQRMSEEYEGTFGDISSSANESLEKLQAAFGHIASSVGLIEDAAVEISTGSRDLTSRSEGQAQAAVKSLEGTNTLQETLIENATQLGKCRTLIDHLDKTTDQGQNVSTRAVETISHIETASEEMSAIVATIDEIAFQTNLLALNASVEAARAGESGKGFAVVASEVRSLAGRCAEASSQIGGLIEQNVSQIKNGAQDVRNSGDAMSDIHNNTRELLSMINAIAQAGDSQAENVRILGSAMAELDASVKSNLTLATNNSKLTSDLLDMKTQLADAVSIFKPNKASYNIAAE